MKELVYKYEIGAKYSVGQSEFMIMDRKIELDKNNKRIKMYSVKCMQCGYTRWKNEKYIVQSINGTTKLSGKGCNHCNQRKRATESNCIASTDPWMIPLLKDPSDAYRYSSRSGIKLWFVCPFCGEEKYLECKQVCRDRKICCNKCGDGITYPNKFGYALLKQLNVDNLTVEYSDVWTLGHRYDFYFTKGNIKYLVEMDGSFHFVDAFNNTTLKKNQETDKIKTQLAVDNGYQLIRVNCLKSDFDYIKDHVYSSELNNLFDLSTVDWSQVEKECISNRVVELCNYYNAHPTDTKRHIAKIFNINPFTVNKYLQQGSRCGFVVLINQKEEYQQKYDSVVKYRNDGLSTKEICEITGIKSYTVYQITRKAISCGDIVNPDVLILYKK